MKQIRVGIFGYGIRGETLVKDFMLCGAEIVAICETRPARLELAKKTFGADVKYSDNFDEFIETEMDAVVLTNFFSEHAPYAIKCFEKNIHVFSECISNGTMAEGVELLRAFKKSKSIYMLAENYPQMLFNREIKRVCAGGTLGKFLFAEGEYNHPVAPDDTGFARDYTYFEKHWRNYLPRTYYITHSLGPIMWATGATPKKVCAFSNFAPIEDDAPTASYVGDHAAIIMTQNNDGSVFRITGCAAFGGHENSYRVCGTKGTIENLRGCGDDVMLRYNSWDIPEGAKEINRYTPGWNDRDEDIIKTSGHGGGDYLTIRNFLDCIKENRQPEHPFDIRSAIAMSSVAILAHRSVLYGGTYDIPDFDNADDCAKYENDRLSPFYGADGSAPTLPCCSKTDFAPTETQIKLYKEML